MTAESRDYLQLMTSPAPSTLDLLNRCITRCDEAEARATALVTDNQRQAQWLDWYEDQTAIYEHRINNLVAENAQLANRVRQAQRDQWLTVLVNVAFVLMVTLLCAAVLVLR